MTHLSLHQSKTTGIFQDLHFSWNFEAAAVIFQEAKAGGKIPPEAFVKWANLSFVHFVQTFISKNGYFQLRRSLGLLLDTTPCKLAYLQMKRRWKLSYEVTFWNICIVVVGADVCLWHHQALFHHSWGIVVIFAKIWLWTLRFWDLLWPLVVRINIYDQGQNSCLKDYVSETWTFLGSV